MEARKEVIMKRIKKKLVAVFYIIVGIGLTFISMFFELYLYLYREAMSWPIYIFCIIFLAYIFFGLWLTEEGINYLFKKKKKRR